LLVPFVTLALVACSAPASQSSTAPHSPSGHASVDTEAVATGTALAQIRGHLRVARELLAAGEAEAAVPHIGHPRAELLTAVTPEIREAGGDPDLLDAAIGAAEAALANGDDEALDGAIEAAIEAARDAEAAVVADPEDPAYRGSVIAALVSSVGGEYSEAVVGGELRELAEFQDARGFLLEAMELYETIRPVVEAASADEADEIATAFEALEAALPGPTPPDTLTAPEDVSAAAARIGAELAEAVGAVMVEERDPTEVGATINSMLDEILELVESGQTDAAAELAAEAYLEHYELLEPAVIAAAPEVNEELEPLLGAELRRRITGGADAEEIGALIDRARELLEEAVAAAGMEH
jgi:hypothetical protein